MVYASQKKPCANAGPSSATFVAQTKIRLDMAGVRLTLFDEVTAYFHYFDLLTLFRISSVFRRLMIESFNSISSENFAAHDQICLAFKNEKIKES